VLDRTCPSDEVVTATKVICDVELPIRVEVNVVLLVLLSLLEDVDDRTEVPEDGVLVKVELGLARVVGVGEVSVVGGSAVVVALTVVVDSVSVVGA
jgi:hypothetical protein